MILLRQARGININIKLFLISLRETTAMMIESILSWVSLSCIDQRDGLCLHSLHGGIFGV